MMEAIKNILCCLLREKVWILQLFASRIIDNRGRRLYVDRFGVLSLQWEDVTVASHNWTSLLLDFEVNLNLMFTLHSLIISPSFFSLS